MKFYTYARLYGDKVLLRGYDDKEGGSFLKKVPFCPTLYLPSNKQTEFKTLDGRYVAPVQPGTIRESKQFLKDYDGVDGATVYGFDRFLYQFLAEEYPGAVDYDVNKIKLW